MVEENAVKRLIPHRCKRPVPHEKADTKQKSVRTDSNQFSRTDPLVPVRNPVAMEKSLPEARQRMPRKYTGEKAGMPLERIAKAVMRLRSTRGLKLFNCKRKRFLQLAAKGKFFLVENSF